MKLYKYLFLPLALCFFINVSFASALPPKMVMLPFKNVPLFSKTYAGIYFNYDMYGSPKRNIVCQLDHIYKSWLEFPNDGAVDESPTYAGVQKVVLTNVDKAKHDNHSDVLHADRAGTIKIIALKQGKRSHSCVSCFYEDSEGH